jgi:hypothetical protein
MSFKTLRWISAAAAVVAVGVQGAARADDAGGFYLGGNFGRAHNTYDTGYIDGSLNQAAAANGDTVSYRARSTRRMSDVWWGDAGYLFNPYIGLEAAYFHLGEIKYWAVGTFNDGNGSPSLSTKTEVTSKGPALSFVLRLPLSDAFEADLHAGDYYGKTTANTLITIGSESEPNPSSKSGSSLLIGVGAAYTIAGHWSVRADAMRVNKAGDATTVGTYSVNFVTLGASYTF